MSSSSRRWRHFWRSSVDRTRLVSAVLVVSRLSLGNVFSSPSAAALEIIIVAGIYYCGTSFDRFSMFRSAGILGRESPLVNYV